MRRSIFIVAASSCLASATWSNGRDLGMGIPSPARETGASGAQVDATGWTPRPTEPPQKEAVMELLRRRRGVGRRQNTNTWINEETCGWFSESSSDAFTCDIGSSCATNQKNVVGCVSGNSSPFYTACLDYQAFKQSACASIGTATGCCTESSWGACGTFLWAGSPPKSMYRCFPEQTIISMLDQPREVLDSLTRSTSSSTTSSKPDTTTSSGPTGTGTNSPSTSGNSGSSSNIGAIVGGVVGGVAGLALIAGLIAYLIIRRKGKYSAVAPTDPAPYPGPAPQPPAPAPQYPSQSPPQMSMAAGGGVPFQPTTAGGTYAPSSPYQQSISTMTTAYDPHQSYYEAPKPAGHISPGQQFTPHQPPYTQAPPHVSPPQQFQPQLGITPELESSMVGHHQGHMSELDSNAMQVGHQYNPAEMGVTTPRPH